MGNWFGSPELPSDVYVGCDTTVRGACRNLEQALRFFSRTTCQIRLKRTMLKPLEGGEPVIAGLLVMEGYEREHVVIQLSHSVFLARLRSRLKLKPGHYGFGESVELAARSYLLLDQFFRGTPLSCWNIHFVLAHDHSGYHVYIEHKHNSRGRSFRLIGEECDGVYLLKFGEYASIPLMSQVAVHRRGYQPVQERHIIRQFEE